MLRVAALIAAGTCIFAGVYMLSIQAAASNSIFESIAHGIGIYFIGKGLFVGALLWNQANLQGGVYDEEPQPE